MPLSPTLCFRLRPATTLFPPPSPRRPHGSHHSTRPPADLNHHPRSRLTRSPGSPTAPSSSPWMRPTSSPPSPLLRPISPSILSANFSKLGEQVKAVEVAGCDWIHVDVMDGRFVPNITIGPLVVNALRPVTDLPLDVHLMIVEPEQRVPNFIKAGADIVSVHCEQSATIHLHRIINQIKSLGAKVGVVLNPGTPISAIEYVLDVILAGKTSLSDWQRFSCKGNEQEGTVVQHVNENSSW